MRCAQGQDLRCWGSGQHILAHYPGNLHHQLIPAGSGNIHQPEIGFALKHPPAPVGLCRGAMRSVGVPPGRVELLPVAHQLGNDGGHLHDGARKRRSLQRGDRQVLPRPLGAADSADRLGEPVVDDHLVQLQLTWLRPRFLDPLANCAKYFGQLADGSNVMLQDVIRFWWNTC